MLQTRLSSLADCGLPSFVFAGFAWPRYLATLPRGSLRKRAESRKPGRAMCGDYYHAPTPGAKGRGFYLDSDGMPGLRWQWADETEGARIRHTGWFTDPDGSGDTIRGIVLRLPHGRGFLAGWSMGEGMASSVDYSPIFDDAADAAACADSMAENVAEGEREREERYRAMESAELDAEAAADTVARAFALRHRERFGGPDAVYAALETLREARQALADAREAYERA